MKAYEDLARLRVEEAIQRGLAAQRYRQAKRGLQPEVPARLAESAQGRELQAATDGRRRQDTFRSLLGEEWARLA